MTDAIALLIPPREKDLGGFTVKRILPFAKHRMVGPWIFFDHMGPAVFEPGKGTNVRPHPHINLATVTYLFEGHIHHRDSLGSDQVITPGAINLMVAGRGIVHSEREPLEGIDTTRQLHGLQLWHALPEADEEIEAAFFHYDAEEIPSVTVEGVPVRVMMGTAYGVTSPVKTYAETLYLEARLSAGQALVLPDHVAERGLYVVSGRATVNGTPVEASHMVILNSGATVSVTTDTEAQLALIGGEPFTERHIYWNFVSSRKERIEQAKADWREGRFPKVPGDEIEFIPLPVE
ncbi:pirin family protein [Asticcacaulis excentricus]|uniref:Pirin domain protein n=1 Tax=Asticcacaulis excentricus (strain ATCC 15261 / DSM 4724 / KCTC 12464 / NCIMB 9791 / VKM B-1370 / CB 48) TaxID=573065 RepID=E8RV48_ASTEC|nr:pirin family protein [Asticcacaulis excentricus]ADU14248.1 Pirin domain protein [Asticcacaulis excentricus CB 48]